MKTVTYFITDNEDWRNLYMAEIEDDWEDEESEHDNESTEDTEVSDEPLYEYRYDNQINIDGDTGSFYLDGLEGIIEHIVEETDGVFHFTFEAEPDNGNSESTVYGRGWITLGNNPRGKLYVHSENATSFSLEASEGE